MTFGFYGFDIDKADCSFNSHQGRFEQITMLQSIYLDLFFGSVYISLCWNELNDLDYTEITFD